MIIHQDAQSFRAKSVVSHTPIHCKVAANARKREVANRDVNLVAERVTSRQPLMERPVPVSDCVHSPLAVDEKLLFELRGCASITER
jgi:hypothetical protein